MWQVSSNPGELLKCCSQLFGQPAAYFTLDPASPGNPRGPSTPLRPWRTRTHHVRPHGYDIRRNIQLSWKVVENKQREDGIASLTSSYLNKHAFTNLHSTQRRLLSAADFSWNIAMFETRQALILCELKPWSLDSSWFARNARKYWNLWVFFCRITREASGEINQ